MEIKENYPTLEEAKTGIRAHEAQGHRILHETHIYRTELVKELAQQEINGKVTDVVIERPASVLDHAEITIDTAPDNTPLPTVDWKAQFQAASTVALKLDVLARHLGLK